MVQGTMGSVLVTIRITVWIQESEVRNPDSPDYQNAGVRRRSELSEHLQFVIYQVDVPVQCMKTVTHLSSKWTGCTVVRMLM